MKPVQPEELSALLDGEIDSQRAREIRAQFEADPDLRAQFDALRQRDTQWRTAAAAAAFDPSISMSTARASTISGPAIVLLVMLMVLVRFVSKVLNIEAMIWGLNVCGLIVVLTATIWLLRNATHSDERATL
jgi:hypothetical protein